jgi:hypothetical protein
MTAPRNYALMSAASLPDAVRLRLERIVGVRMTKDGEKDSETYRKDSDSWNWPKRTTDDVAA